MADLLKYAKTRIDPDELSIKVFSPGAVKLTRPVKTAQIIITGLDDTVTSEEVADVVVSKYRIHQFWLKSDESGAIVEAAPSSFLPQFLQLEH